MSYYNYYSNNVIVIFAGGRHPGIKISGSLDPSGFFPVLRDYRCCVCVSQDAWSPQERCGLEGPPWANAHFCSLSPVFQNKLLIE